MSDTVGSLVDKLATVNEKLFATQDKLFFIRKMSFDEFKQTYGTNDEDLKVVYDYFKRAADLNVQRQALILELDKKLIEVISAAVKGENLDNGSFVQDQHKTY
jgi:hypothetical protein